MMVKCRTEQAESDRIELADLRLGSPNELAETSDNKIVTLRFNSLAFRLRSKDLKHLISIPVHPVSRVSIYSVQDILSWPL